MKLLRIEAPYFVVGLVIGSDNRVRHVPPIIGYMRWWGMQQVVSYAKEKGWRVFQEKTPSCWEAV